MGYEFVPGMKVSWIVTDSKKTPQEVEPYVSGRKFEHRPDCRYYAERVAQTAARATEVFGWGEKDLLTGSQQVTLFDSAFAGGSDTGSKKKEPGNKKAVRKPDLRDFMNARSFYGRDAGWERGDQRTISGTIRSFRTT